MKFKIKKLRFVLLPIVLLLIMNSCYYDSEEFLYPQLFSSCDTTNVTYSGSIKPVLNTYCFSCHGNSTANTLGVGLNLEDFNGLKKEVDNGWLMGAITHKSGFFPMPLNSSKLDDCTIATFKIWVNSGAPNN